MNFALDGSARIEKNKYIVSIGEYEVVTFVVNDRYVSNNRRRSKNMAIHICMQQVGLCHNYNNIWGVGNSVPACLDTLSKLGVPTDEFIALLEAMEWGDQLPDSSQSSFLG